LGIKVVALQYGLTDDEQALIARDPVFTRIPSGIDLKNDLEEVFALLVSLPLIVSLPGTTQHMAGAVGAKVICPAHPFEAAWRVMPGRAHELWAPSVKIVTGEPAEGLAGSVKAAIQEVRRSREGNTDGIELA
jgi:hypothetical protein